MLLAVFCPFIAEVFSSIERLLTLKAASQISVSENCSLTSALHPIAAAHVLGFRRAARDPKPAIHDHSNTSPIMLTGRANPTNFSTTFTRQQRQSQNPPKGGDGKPRVLASFEKPRMTPRRTQDCRAAIRKCIGPERLIWSASGVTNRGVVQ